MDRKTATLIGAAASLAAAPIAGAASASEPATPVAASYADLLEPIPNAIERLQASDAERAQSPPAVLIQTADRHHHHHHAHYYRSRAWYRAHGYAFIGGRWVLRPRAHHHHHNHDHR